jgi:dTDP-4-dehydrorhamnose reductase
VKNVLIVGLESQIGHILYSDLKSKKFNVFGTSRNKEKVNSRTLFFDLENNKINLKLSPFDVVVICAGHEIKKCAENPIESERINVKNTIQLIDECAKNNCFTIFLSSVKVFDGSKQFYDINSKPSPNSNYGRYKLAVEEHIKENVNFSACVLRLTKVMTKKPDFIKWWNKEYSENTKIKVYKNHFLSPIPINFVVESTLLLIQKQKHGLYQLGVDEEISYHNYAKQVFSENEKALGLLEPHTDSSPIYNSLETYLP